MSLSDATSELHHLLQYIARDDTVVSKQKVTDAIIKVIGYLNDSPEKEKPIEVLLGGGMIKSLLAYFGYVRVPREVVQKKEP